MKCSVCSLLGFLGVLNKKSPVQRQRSNLPEDIGHRFSLAEIKSATNNFHPISIIGKSWQGTIHRGTIDDGTIDVAVKRYQTTSSEVANAFRHEALLLSQVRPPHIVSHLGFCDEQNEMIIVYAYMITGPLSAFLSDTMKKILFHSVGNIEYTYVLAWHEDHITFILEQSML